MILKTLYTQRLSPSGYLKSFNLVSNPLSHTLGMRYLKTTS